MAYLVSNSGLFFSHGAATGFPNFTFTYQWNVFSTYDLNFDL